MEEKQVREIRIVVSGKRIVLAGLLASILFFAAVMGTLTLAGVMRTDRAEADVAQQPSALATSVGNDYWMFAEGYTGPGFDEWIVIWAQTNPTYPWARARLSFMAEGTYLGEYVTAPFQQRLTININDVLVNNFSYSGNVAITVGCYDDVGGPTIHVPSICERAMYWNYQDKWAGGCSILGYPFDTL